MNISPKLPCIDRRQFSLSALALGGGALLSPSLFAQAPRKRAPAKRKEEAKPPQPLTLETKDGVALRAVYFPGSRGKETVPIIMLHGWEQRGVVWEPLAAYLQKAFGHAVIVPDLRGHGQSVAQTQGVKTATLEPDDLTAQDLGMMVWDVQACKKHLLEEHNKGELNIEMLTVVGAEFGALVAMYFTALDWSWPVLTTGKQGQDVKAMALLTPIDQFKRMSVGAALQGLRLPIASGKFSALIIAGQQDRTGYSDAKRLHRQLEAMFPQQIQEEALRLVTPDTASHGTQLIEPERRLGMEVALTNFIGERVVARKSEFEWAERRSPLPR